MLWVIWMSKLDFQLNYYFEKYKDTSIVCRNDFRQRFRKENGSFKYLEELIIMIERYQIKKYGTSIDRSNFIHSRNKEERNKVNNNYQSWKRRRLGKWKEKYLKAMIVISNSTMKWKIR